MSTYDSAFLKGREKYVNIYIECFGFIRMATTYVYILYKDACT